MNRRTVLAALGSLGAGGAVVTGTGAFTSVAAKRDLTVAVADDANALLALEPGDGENGDYVETDDGTLGINISGTNDGFDGSGVNTDAITVFEDIFTIRNQGTQEVSVGVTPVGFLDVENFGSLLVLIVPTSNFPRVSLPVGQEEQYSIIAASISADISNLGVDSEISVEAQA
jgi:hypothetical protein